MNHRKLSLRQRVEMGALIQRAYRTDEDGFAILTGVMSLDQIVDTLNKERRHDEPVITPKHVNYARGELLGKTRRGVRQPDADGEDEDIAKLRQQVADLITVVKAQDAKLARLDAELHELIAELGGRSTPPPTPNLNGKNAHG